MDALYNHALEQLDKAFRILEEMVPPPQKVPHGNTYVFRYKEQTIQQAMLQKLARVISGLRSASLLLENGFLQDQSALHRILDEFHEDILFLAYAVINDDQTETHQKYLYAFYKEEFCHDTGKWLPGRKWVSRRDIRAYLATFRHPSMDSSDGGSLSQQIQNAYSGFIHGNSAHIMDMVQGNPPKFRLQGMRGTQLHELHQDDLYNAFFHAIISFAFVAEAFGNEELLQSLHDYHLEFDAMSGRNNAYRQEPP